MEILNLLTSQTRTIEAAIVRADFPTKDFVSGVAPSRNFPGQPGVKAGSLSFGKYYFNFDNARSQFRSQWSPAKESTTYDDTFNGWEEQFEQFKLWLTYLKRETEYRDDAPLADELFDADDIDAAPDGTFMRKEAGDVVHRAIADTNSRQEQLKATIADFDHLDVVNLQNKVFDSGLIRSLPSLASLVVYFRDIATIDLSTLSGDELGRLIALAKDVRSWGEILKDETELGSSVENNIRVGADTSFHKNRGTLRQIIAYGKTSEFDFEGNKARGVDFLKSIEQSKTEVDGLVKRLKEESSKVTVANEARHFAQEATKHSRLAWIWMILTAFLAAYSFYFAKENYDLVVDNIKTGTDLFGLTNYQSAQFVVAKVVIFSFLLGGLYWLGRVYKAHRHNCVVNRHRANALNTFRVFVESTADDQVKNAVLIHAAHCIFTPQSSGYIQQDNDGVVPQIVEVVKDLSKQTK